MIGEKVDCISPTVSPLSLKINADCFCLERLHLIQSAVILPSAEGM